MKRSLQIHFECGQEDRVSTVFGPYEFIQVTYNTVRVGDEGERELATLSQDLWFLEDGTYWTDFIIEGVVLIIEGVVQ